MTSLSPSLSPPPWASLSVLGGNGDLRPSSPERGRKSNSCKATQRKIVLFQYCWSDATRTPSGACWKRSGDACSGRERGTQIKADPEVMLLSTDDDVVNRTSTFPL
ncbi:hypothetical protein KGM_202757 [Danaus plexippus plexippus]|uniref:Uncharacterized protein n=1 Tax=Danaus plexippus plexippus TaxID=278856 RepID=A0A212F200_DANPL|nr:hypothetical protein KGM_202757 [Danaus plexippus plexippus]